MLKILKHATNHLTANMQTRMCEDTKDTKDTNEPKDREDVKDTQTSIHATTHMHTQQRH